MQELSRTEGGPLNSVEQVELVRLESIIREGKDTFWEVGAALWKIREHRLYTEEHDSFEAYCLDMWDIPRLQADRLIDAHKVRDVVPITKESHARVLKGLTDEQQKEAHAAAEEEAGEEGKVTARMLADAADEIRKSLSEPDKGGVPDDEAYRQIIILLTQALHLLGRTRDNPWMEWSFIRNHLSNTKSSVTYSTPHCRCPKCKSHDPNCQLCKGTGWIPKGVWQSIEKEYVG